jgi:hypothetical protein
MLTCVQCKAPVDGSATRTYTVGWCQKDIHLGCFLHHCASCAACRFHNEAYLSYHREKGTTG